MEENQHDLHGTMPDTYEHDRTLYPTIYQLYEAIDWNAHMFESEASGKKETYLGMEFGNILFSIEQFVQEMRFPRQTGHRFHGKPITDSTANRPPGPAQTGQQFRLKLDSLKRPESA